ASSPSKVEAMGKNNPLSKDEVSREFVRRIGKRVNKFELDASAVGIRYSTQLHREIRRLHTFRPGERCELDYTKYGQWLYPTKHWNDPLFFFTGLGLDHTGDVCSGFVVTSQPTAASTIRLYKRCVLPSQLWLPEYLQKYADDWDVCGLSRLVAVDNAMDATS